MVIVAQEVNVMRTLSLVLMIVTVACSPADQGSSDPNGNCFSVGYLDITASAPLFIAEAEGYFDSVGVCVESEAFTTSNQLVDALAADRLDYVVETSAVPALALATRDTSRFQITAASTITPDEPFDAILALRRTNIQSLTDLAGRRIGVFPGTTATALLREFLDSEQVSTEGIEFVPTAPGNQLSALRSGAIDALHAYEPTWAVALADSAVVEVHGTVYGMQLAPNPQGLSLMNRRTLASRPEASRSLIDAFDRASSLMRTDESRSRSILRSRFDLPDDAIERMHLLYMVPADSVDWSALEAYAALLVTAGELDSVPPLSALRN